jgi:hypothetical protein
MMPHALLTKNKNLCDYNKLALKLRDCCQNRRSDGGPGQGLAAIQLSAKDSPARPLTEGGNRPKSLALVCPEC